MKRESKSIDNEYKSHVVLMKEAGIREIGRFLDKLMAAKIIIARRVEQEFRMDKDTLGKLRKEDMSVSISTLRKMPFVMAYYLVENLRDIQAEPYGKEKKNKLAGINAYIDEYKRLFGYQAKVCLGFIDEGRDLRLILSAKKQATNP